MGACKQKLRCQGTFIVELPVQDKVTKEQEYVIENLEPPFLGRKPAELLKLISRLTDSLRGNQTTDNIHHCIAPFLF